MGLIKIKNERIYAQMLKQIISALCYLSAGFIQFPINFYKSLEICYLKASEGMPIRIMTVKDLLNYT
jgi:hypothetical protein